MKVKIKRQTYYVIIKDVLLTKPDDTVDYGSGPVEVLESKDKAINLVYRLNRASNFLSDILKRDNPEKIKDASIKFRICTMDPECRQTTEEMLTAYDEYLKEEENGKSDESGDQPD